MLKAAEISSQHSAFIIQLDFPSTITTPSIGENTTFNHTPVVSQCILIAAGRNSTALLLANITDRPEVKTTAFCVVCKKKAKTSKPHPLLPSLENQGGGILLEYADNSLQGLTHSLGEQKAEPSA